MDELSEQELMAVRADLGMVFQEGALFDSLTVRENVGYRLFEETRQPIDEVDARVDEVLGFVGLGEFGDRMPSELSGGQRRRVAIARAMTARPASALRRADHRPRSDHGADDRRRDHQAARPRAVTSIVVTHQLRDAFYIATHRAVSDNGEVAFEPAPPGPAGRRSS